MGQIAENLAKNMKKRRKKIGWTQQDLAEKCEYSLENIKRIETAKNFVSEEGLDRIATALNIEPSLLLAGPKTQRFSGELTTSECCEILAKLEGTEPLRRSLALAILFDDRSILPPLSEDMEAELLGFAKAD